MLNTRLYQGYTNAISASSLLPLRSHSASLRNGEKLQKTAGRGAKDTALALPMSLVFESRNCSIRTRQSIGDAEPDDPRLGGIG